MIEKLTVIFFVLLFLIVGVILIVFPWVNFGIISWNNNYLLAFAARTTGLTFLQTVVASGWIRGAVSGLGILNLFFAFWEMAHFNRNVQMLSESGKK
ncbi:MAG: hypothetical protein M3033_06710 [Acidobacteriota bacterium]|nr:hypothetical protein [Acidobacteriota bacterium]